MDHSYVSKIINDLTTKNSSGYDGLSTKLLKYLKFEILESITIIINQILNTGIFPEGMKIAKVIPLFKKNSQSEIENYRPVSLLPSLSKIVEKIVFNQLISYLNKHSLLFNGQYGFRANHSTELAALHLHDEIVKLLDNSKTPLTIFLDLSKAFDTLDHKILLYKLSHYGLKSTELNFFKSYLQDRKQYVFYEGSESNFETIKMGVPQGSI